MLQGFSERENNKHVYGLRVWNSHRERKNGDAKDEAVQRNKIPKDAEGNGPHNIDRIINLAIQKRYSFHFNRGKRYNIRTFLFDSVSFLNEIRTWVIC